jgi:hypothetical protein
MLIFTEGSRAGVLQYWAARSFCLVGGVNRGARAATAVFALQQTIGTSYDLGPSPHIEDLWAEAWVKGSQSNREKNVATLFLLLAVKS